MNSAPSAILLTAQREHKRRGAGGPRAQHSMGARSEGECPPVARRIDAHPHA